VASTSISHYRCRWAPSEPAGSRQIGSTGALVADIARHVTRWSFNPLPPPRGPGLKPGASSYTRKRLSLSNPPPPPPPPPPSPPLPHLPPPPPSPPPPPVPPSPSPPMKRERERDASACMRRHQASALAPVPMKAGLTLMLKRRFEQSLPCPYRRMRRRCGATGFLSLPPPRPRRHRHCCRGRRPGTYTRSLLSST